MDRLLLRGGRVYAGGVFAEADVLCERGKIAAVGRALPAGDAEVFDCRGLRVAPGFIDAHTHGANGVDVNAADRDDLLRLGAFFAAQGVTAWQASVLTDTEERTLWCLRQIEAAMRETGRGARLLGAHLEGPFLSPAYKGAMPEALLRKGDEALFRRYQQAAPGVVRYLTVSPEVEGVPELIERVAEDVVVAVGHSGADYDAAMRALRGGARCVTHTFNAMRLFHQHEPAIMGAALESDAWCEMICDGRHLHPASVRLLIKCKGPDRVIAVTDSIMAAGLSDGRYRLGVNDVTVLDGDATLTETGMRAGSTLTMREALRNLVRFTGQPVEALLPMLTSNVAKALRLSERKGAIAVGMDADMVLLDDDLGVAATFAGGACVYRA